MVVIFRFGTLILGLTLCLSAQQTVAEMVLPLWPDRLDTSRETVQPDRGDGVLRLTDVINPSLEVFLVPPSPHPAPAVLVCPGGGYSKLAYNKEGTEIATWLNGIGVSAFVLKYRVPDNRAGAFADAQRAMGIIRHRAAEWNVDKSRLGVLGFSAGGHLAASVSTRYATRGYESVDDADEQSVRPDFTVLVYPAYIAADGYAVVPEIPVDGNTPPAFIVQTQDDTHYINSSIAYYTALKEGGVPAELHLFPVGGHGYGMRPSGNAVSSWPKLVARWLETTGVLTARH